MANAKRLDPKLIIGIGISLVCMVLAFRKVDVADMWLAFKTANYWYLIPTVLVIFLSHYLRALRWRYLLDPIRRLDIGSLFSSLVIGYAVNTFMPAHLGEFVRAYVLGKKRQIPMSPVFATIVVERMIDVFTLLVLMLLALFVYPFPKWAINSGYIMLAGTVGLLVFLVLLKKATSPTLKFVRYLLKPFPERFRIKIETILENFLAGIVPLKRWHDYMTTGILSLSIWLCYGLAFFLCLYAFNLAVTYNLGWVASLILLVITTIAVVVPSSPGYVGTYHYLCQITLAMFGVPGGLALSYATLVHGINFLPVLIVGIVFAHHEGMAILKASRDVSELKKTAPQEVS